MTSIKIGSTYKTKNYGDIVILSYTNKNNVAVKFADTGFETTTRSCQIRTGSVRDLLKKTICGTGFHGEGKYSSKIDKEAYSAWSRMMCRCYAESVHKARPTYKDCTVCDEWHNFQNFAEWYYENKIDGCVIDKDFLCGNNKTYSPSTCLFIPPDINTSISLSKEFLFISPDGVAVDVYNLSKFCNRNNLNKGHMSEVHSGYRESHKGWRAK